MIGRGFVRLAMMLLFRPSDDLGKGVSNLGYDISPLLKIL